MSCNNQGSLSYIGSRSSVSHLLLLTIANFLFWIMNQSLLFRFQLSTNRVSMARKPKFLLLVVQPTKIGYIWFKNQMTRIRIWYMYEILKIFMKKYFKGKKFDIFDWMLGVDFWWKMNEIWWNVEKIIWVRIV